MRYIERGSMYTQGYEANMGHQGAQAPCLKYVYFAYNYAYLRVYISKIHISNSYIPKKCISKIYIPRIYISNIYIYSKYIYVHTFTYLRYICQKNNILKVYIPYLCLLSMCKVIHTSGYVQSIMYFIRIEYGAQALWCSGYFIYICVCVWRTYPM
jgi:hypothetical protein